MTLTQTGKRRTKVQPQPQSPRVTVILNDELDQWIKSGAKATGLAAGAFVRMKLTELCQQPN